MKVVERVINMLRVYWVYTVVGVEMGLKLIIRRKGVVELGTACSGKLNIEVVDRWYNCACSGSGGSAGGFARPRHAWITRYNLWASAPYR